jgi:hypothetical protein
MDADTDDTKDTQEDQEAEALFGIVAHRYGDRLTPDQLERVKEGVEAAMELAGALRGVRLDNHVEPFSTFRPYRGEGSP